MHDFAPQPQVTELVPFGKYKGQPLDVLRQDSQYMDWMMAQPWFKERYPKHYSIIINNFAEPSETPEHNAMQAMFLDDALCRRLVSILLAARGESQYDHQDSRINVEFEVQGFDVHITHPACTFLVELKPTLGDEYPAVLRQIITGGRYDGRRRTLIVGSYLGTGATFDMVIEIFRRSSVHVVMMSEIV
jgi:hypothetical protein